MNNLASIQNTKNDLKSLSTVCGIVSDSWLLARMNEAYNEMVRKKFTSID